MSEQPGARATARGDFVLVALLALAVCAIGVRNDFVYDDVSLIVENVRVHSLAQWRDILTRPYWPPPFIENLYRPLTVLLMAVEWAIGSGSPLAFRIVSYLLYAACCAGVLSLAGRLFSRRTAVAAALLFAVHPVHVEAVALGVNQGELLVGLLVTLALCRYLDRRRAGDLRRSDWVALLSLYAVACLTKENGFVLPAILLVAESLLVTGEPVRLRFRRLAGGYAAMAAVGITLLALRGVLLSGRIAGATPNADLAGLDVGGRIVTMLQVIPQWARLLMWPQRLQVDFPRGAFAAPDSLGTPELLGIALLVAAVVSVVLARRRAPAVSFGLAACGGALLPVSNIVPTGVMLAERTLFLPSIGFVIAAAGAGAHLARLAPFGAVRTRQALMVACSVLMVLGFARSARRHAAWNSAHLRIAPSSTAPVRF